MGECKVKLEPNRRYLVIDSQLAVICQKNAWFELYILPVPYVDNIDKRTDQVHSIVMKID